MHVLAVKSVATLLRYLTDKLKKTPLAEIIQTWNTDVVAPEVVEKKVIFIKVKCSNCLE